MRIQWYPGHMAKSLRLIEENLKLVDIVLYVLDSRIPASCRNPAFDALLGNKPVIYLLNKSDLADARVTTAWAKSFSAGGGTAAVINGTVPGTVRGIPDLCRKALSEKLRRYEEKGVNYTVKAMIIGIPNCGKSTVINSMVGKAAAKTGNRPGVTRDKQWLRLAGQVDLLDTPGVLWGDLKDQETARHLAFCGCIKDEVMDSAELAQALLSELTETGFSAFLAARYKLKEEELKLPPPALFQRIGIKRGCLVKGGEIDSERTASLILDDFRSGSMGRISLEKPGAAAGGEEQGEG